MLNTILVNEAGTMNIFMILALIVIFYFFMIRPQQKRQKEFRALIENLTNGSQIVTAGGIYGVIKDVKDTFFIVEIADGVRIRLSKGSIDQNATAQLNNPAPTKK